MALRGPGLLAKLSDDLSESVISGLSAGSARFFGLGGALVFYFAQRGSDAKLPQGTQLEVLFNRDLAVSTSQAAEPPR